MFTSIIYVGEESGALDEILEKTADYYEEEADAAVTRLVGLMEPLLIVFMGVAIGLCLAGISHQPTAHVRFEIQGSVFCVRYS